MPGCRACTDAADLNQPELHNECPGESRCTCQHRVEGRPPLSTDELMDAGIAASQEKEGREVISSSQYEPRLATYAELEELRKEVAALRAEISGKSEPEPTALAWTDLGDDEEVTESDQLFEQLLDVLESHLLKKVSSHTIQLLAQELLRVVEER